MFRSHIHYLRRIYVPLILLLLFSAAPVALAQDVRPSHTEPGWRASYWSNRALSGAPTVNRTDSELNFDWGLDRPDPTLPNDDFSARWERYIDVMPGLYAFTATADDGIRVWVDGELLINDWSEHAVRTNTAEKYLGAGHHLIRVEYFESRGAAVAKVEWGLVSSGGGNDNTGEWRAQYYNNTSLSGTPALVRNEQTISYSWGAAPAPQVNADNFSVRWVRNVDLPAGNYRFFLTVDDGARLFVNGHTLIDAWRDQPPTEYTGDLFLPGGLVTVQLEYYERDGGATVGLEWQRIGGNGGTPISDWRGEYYNNRTLSGSPVLVRNDNRIDFDWSTGSPAPGQVDVDGFSVRWTRTVNFTAGNYRFTTTVDDGVRLYINGRLVLESWREQAPTSYTADLYLPNGPAQIEMQYFEAFGGATARLRWDPVGTNPPTPTATPTLPPTPRPPTSGVIVDNTDPGFVKGGDPRGWSTQSEGYGGSLLWSRNNDRANYNYNWGRWYPRIQAGRYEVFVYIPYRYTTTGNARYWISHRDGLSLRQVSQSANGDRWVSLGTYSFQGTEKDYVSLADVTFEYRLSRLIAWDAMKWEHR